MEQYYVHMRMGQNVQKFGENRSKGSKVIQILVKYLTFKMASPAILDFEIRFFGTALLLNVSRGLSM